MHSFLLKKKIEGKKPNEQTPRNNYVVSTEPVRPSVLSSKLKGDRMNDVHRKAQADFCRTPDLTFSP